MGVIMWISRYVMVGLILSLILDLLNRNNPNPDKRFTNNERLTIMLWWPVAVIVFVYHFIGGGTRNDD